MNLGIHLGTFLIPFAENSQLLPAREQMAFTLGFHIILSCFGVAFPAMMLVANYIGLKKNDEVALLLAQRWSKVAAVLFAVGAVTGTVLTFEFGLLWPEFMSVYGDAFGVGFAIEGIFFFLEAIFIAIYILGWKRLSGWAHFWSGIPIFICGIGGAFAVVAMNSWMNQPAGYVMNAAGEITKVEPLKVIFNNATSYEVPHMILAAYMVTGFVVASVYAVGIMRGRRDRYHRLGMLVPLTIALALAPVQFFVGDTAARAVAEHQPLKFAAMECVYETGTHQPEYLGGICIDGEVKGGIKIPNLDSILVGFSPNTEVIGLDSAPPQDRPKNLTMLHLSFDLMVGIGSAYLLLGLWLAFSWWKHRDFPQTKWFLRVIAISGVAAIAALEAGWIVTEVGRQPWIVYEEMRVEEAVTGASGVWVTFTVVFIVYVVLGAVTIATLKTMAKRWRETGEDDPAGMPYGVPELPPEEEEPDEHS